MTREQLVEAWRELLIIAKRRGDDDQAAWIADRILDLTIRRKVYP